MTKKIKTDGEALITIVVVNWNGRKWLKKCLDSLKDQTFHKFEIVLVDNSSTDDSVEFVKKNYPRVKIVHSKNKGFGYACNLGAKKAGGKLVMFFNEDMYVDRDFIEKYVEAYKKIKNKSNVGTIGCAVADYDRSKVISENMYGYRIDLMAAPIPNFDPNRIFHNTGCPLLVIKNSFLEIGGFCENIFLYGEDIDICWRFSLYGYKHYFLRDVYIYHNCAVGSFSENKLRNYMKGEINCIFNNFSLIFLPFSFIYFLTFYMFLSIIYLLLGKWSYVKVIYVAIWQELKYNRKNIVLFRKNVQEKRIISDRFMLKRMSFFPARIINLLYMKNYSQEESYFLKHLLKCGKSRD